MVLLGKLWKTLGKSKMSLAPQGFSADKIIETAVFPWSPQEKKFSLMWGQLPSGGVIFSDGT
jgi:hypothetical protein